MKAILFSLLGLFTTTALLADEMIRVPVSYELGGAPFDGMLIYEAEAAEEGDLLPGILMFPNWMGPTEAAFAKAEAIADDEFVVFVADMYGRDIRPQNSQEAGAAAGTVRDDRSMMRQRALRAIDVFDGLADAHPIDVERTVAIGFCFGGGTVLELARSGTEKIEGVVSFHGDLMSPTLQRDAGRIAIPQLVLHGADDPFVPQEDVQAYVSAMQAREVEDWTLVQFSNTVHSFTDPSADSEGARYHPRSAERAFEMMEDFIEEWTDEEDEEDDSEDEG